MRNVLSVRTAWACCGRFWAWMTGPAGRLVVAGIVALSLSGGVASAQTGTPTSKLAWDQAASDLATAQALTFKYYPDGATTGTVLTGVTCSGTAAPFVCAVNFPAFTPGSHTVQLTASNAAGESVKSASFSFSFVVIPAAPVNLRIQ